MAPDLVLRSTRVVLPEGMRAASIRVVDGCIAAVGDYGDPCDVDAGDDVILPGLVDTHVHINEPGRTEWEGFATATKAAAASGITTLIEMPLNSIPATISVQGLAAKIASAAGQCWVDVGFWGGVVPGNEAELSSLFEAGCFGFKCFLSPSGVEEFANVSEHDLRRAMPVLSRLGAVLQVHAELPGFLLDSQGDCREYCNYLASRPPTAEREAIALLIQLSRETGCRVHVVHLATAEALDLLRQAKRDSVPISVETCPHYLTFCAEQIAQGATEFKCAPPIRDGDTREALWEALRERLIDAVVTDHSPCPPELKLRTEGDFFGAWGGIASLQVSLSAIWTEASHRGFTLEDVARWMSYEPASLAGLEHRKGAIHPGLDADLVLFDPDAEWTVDATRLQHRHKITPYAGRRLRGVVNATYLRGNPISISGPPLGECLRRGSI